VPQLVVASPSEKSPRDQSQARVRAAAEDDRGCDRLNELGVDDGRDDSEAPSAGAGNLSLRKTRCRRSATSRDLRPAGGAAQVATARSIATGRVDPGPHPGPHPGRCGADHPRSQRRHDPGREALQRSRAPSKSGARRPTNTEGSTSWLITRPASQAASGVSFTKLARQRVNYQALGERQ
jgi:hypothetical protein